MDKKFIELAKEKRKLNKEIQDLDNNITEITEFIDRTSYFKSKKSLKAIREIKNYLEQAKISMEEKSTRKDEIDKFLYKECKHPIVISDETSCCKFCPICGYQYYYYGIIDEYKPIYIKVDDCVIYYELEKALCYGDLHKYSLSSEPEKFIMNSVENITKFINEAMDSEDTHSFINENIDELLEIEYDDRNIIDTRSHKKLVNIRRMI